MPFKIIRNDITKVKADAIVNTANPLPAIGSGTDSAIYKAAGKKQLLAEREKIGIMYPGQAASTPAFKLKAKYIIHTIGPVWKDGNHGERDILRDCYRNSLHLAAELSCKSIAFPLIATGVYGFPKDEALQIALAEINRFLLENDMRIILVVFDEKAFELSGKLVEDIEEYIDGESAKAIREAEYGMEEPYNRRNGRSAYLSASDPRMARRLEALELLNRRQKRETESIVVSAAVPPEQSLDDMLANTGDTFQQRLLQLIIESGLKNSEIYHRANISKQLFSKIISDVHCKPKKKTVISLAIALELDLPQTKDLLSRAGYALSQSSKFDLIISYFITHKKYNIIEINAALFDYGESLLGY